MIITLQFFKLLCFHQTKGHGTLARYEEIIITNPEGCDAIMLPCCFADFFLD